MKKKDTELNPASEFGASTNRSIRKTNKTKASKGKKISNIMKGSLLAATVGVTVVVVSTLGVSCKPKTIGVSTASFSVVVSDSAENIADGGFGGVDFVLQQMPSGKEISSGVLSDVNTVLDFNGLKPATTYMISFTVPDEEGGDRLLNNYVFTTRAPKAIDSSGGGDPFDGQEDDIVDEPPEELPDPGVAVPDVLGLTLENATTALNAAGFKNVTHSISEDYNDAPEGTVIAQDTTGVAYLGQAIHLTLSKGPRVYVAATPSALTCAMSINDNLVEYRVAWKQNDAEDATMAVSINGRTLKTYSASDTAARVSNGEYVFDEPYVALVEWLDEYEYNYYALGRDMKVSFVLSYKLNGQVKTSTQSKTFRFGGATMTSFNAEITARDETQTRVGYYVTIALEIDAFGYTELGTSSHPLPFVEITKDAYTDQKELGTIDGQIVISADGKTATIEAQIIHMNVPDGVLEGRICIPVTYHRETDATETYRRNYWYSFVLDTSIGG